MAKRRGWGAGHTYFRPSYRLRSWLEWVLLVVQAADGDAILGYTQAGGLIHDEEMAGQWFGDRSGTMGCLSRDILVSVEAKAAASRREADFMLVVSESDT